MDGRIHLVADPAVHGSVIGHRAIHLHALRTTDFSARGRDQDQMDLYAPGITNRLRVPML